MSRFFNRWQVFTHRGIQVKLALVFFLWFAVFVISFGFIYLINYKTASDRTLGMLLHDQLMTRMILISQTKELAVSYGLAAIVYMVLACVHLMVYAHRLTGPVFKLTKHLERAMEEGKLPGPITFRKTDAFPELAQTFNAFLERVELKEAPARRTNP